MTHTPEQIQAYQSYIAAGKLLYAAVKPTNQELQAAVEAALDSPREIIQDYFCLPDDEDEAGDKGFTAAYIYEMREVNE